MSEQKIINFMGQRKIAAALSILLLIGSIASLATNGLKMGLDFTGGTQVELGYEKAVELEPIRQQLSTAGFENFVVVYFGSDTEILIRLQQGFSETLGNEVMGAISAEAAEGEKPQLRRIEFVGPQVGEELREDGGLGMLVALLVVMLYVAFRFQFKFSVGSVLALAHDVLLVLGLFSVLQLDFDLTVLAAVLAVIGYSLNDTIVVSDRIRENFRLLRKAEPIDVINESLSQTLGRTLITSLTTMLVLLALFFVGGELIHNFSIALLAGIVVGTYSSIYVAANVLLLMGVTKEDLIVQVVETEGEEGEEVLEGDEFFERNEQRRPE
ncbi:MAG: protein translocase subunit SecF [Cellvibrionaceae bacterium]